MQFSDEKVREIIERIERELGARRIKKYDFYYGSGVSSALFSNWNTGKVKPTTAALTKVAEFLGVSLDYLITGKEHDDDDEINELRQIMRERPEMPFLLKLAKNAKASDILQASALLQRLQEESDNK